MNSETVGRHFEKYDATDRDVLPLSIEGLREIDNEAVLNIGLHLRLELVENLTESYFNNYRNLLSAHFSWRFLF